jgi:hypothetical protein
MKRSMVFILLGAMLGMLLFSLDQLIVATAKHCAEVVSCWFMAGLFG